MQRSGQIASETCNLLGVTWRMAGWRYVHEPEAFSYTVMLTQFFIVMAALYKAAKIVAGHLNFLCSC